MSIVRHRVSGQAAAALTLLVALNAQQAEAGAQPDPADTPPTADGAAPVDARSDASADAPPVASPDVNQSVGPKADAAPHVRSKPDRGGFTIRPRLIGNLRLRYEFADDDIQPQNSTALTLRYRGTAEIAVSDRLTFLGEIEAVGELVNNFNDGRLNWSLASEDDLSRKARPVIADPGGVELNRAQAIVKLSDTARATLGRQRIVLDDERFIGVSAFRQNDRTLDAARLNGNLGKSVLFDAGYIRRVRRIIRDDAGFGFFNGDSYYVNVNAPAPYGRLSVFHYALDLETGPEADRSSESATRTTGARVEGRRFWGDRGITWEGSYARQTDFAANPFDFSANYWLGEIGVEARGIGLSGRTEILSGNDNAPAFSTPLATLRRFQGNADIFFTTPDAGIVDISLRSDLNLGSVGPFRDVRAFARHHWFSAETTGDQYGTEFDAELSVTYGRTVMSAAVARFRTRGFASDTDRLFLTIAHAF